MARAVVVRGAGLVDQRKTFSRGDLLFAVMMLLRALLVVLALLLLLASQDGRKLETRCMVRCAVRGWVESGIMGEGVGDVF